MRIQEDQGIEEGWVPVRDESNLSMLAKSKPDSIVKEPLRRGEKEAKTAKALVSPILEQELQPNLDTIPMTPKQRTSQGLHLQKEFSLHSSLAGSKAGGNDRKDIDHAKIT